MEFIALTQLERDVLVAQNIHAREMELFTYELNKQNYQHMLDSMKDLPDEWPEELVQFKSLSAQQMTDNVNAEQLEATSQLAYRDRLRHLLTTETIEQEKSRKVLEALKKQLPEDRRQVAFDEAAKQRNNR